MKPEIQEKLAELEAEAFSVKVAAAETLEDRFGILLMMDGEPRGYWQHLEEVTGVSAQRWRKVLAKRQRPTPDMIEALVKLKPEHAFWLVTGTLPSELLKHSVPTLRKAEFERRLVTR